MKQVKILPLREVKKEIIVIAFFLFLFSSSLQSRDLLTLLNDQVDAFNQQDIEKLVSNVTDDMKYFYISADELITETSGKEAFKQAMINYFKSGITPVSSIESYVVDGNKISFKEVISYTNKKDEKVTSSAMGIYLYKDEKIFRTWYFVD